MQHQNVGAIVKAARLKAGLSQKDVADRLGVTQRAVASSEAKATMGIARLARLAKALGLRLVVTLSS